MMEAALVSRGAEQGALRARNAELASQLRAAALEGDDARIRRLLSELLRFQGLSKGQRVSLQMKALLNVVQALRCVALTDDLPGLSLSVGVAHFNSRRPVGIDELLTDARQAMHEHKRVSQLASSEMTPHTV